MVVTMARATYNKRTTIHNPSWRAARGISFSSEEQLLRNNSEARMANAVSGNEPRAADSFPFSTSVFTRVFKRQISIRFQNRSRLRRRSRSSITLSFCLISS